MSAYFTGQWQCEPFASRHKFCVGDGYKLHAGVNIGHQLQMVT